MAQDANPERQAAKSNWGAQSIPTEAWDHLVRVRTREISHELLVAAPRRHSAYSDGQLLDGPQRHGHVRVRGMTVHINYMLEYRARHAFQPRLHFLQV